MVSSITCQSRSYVTYSVKRPGCDQGSAVVPRFYSNSTRTNYSFILSTSSAKITTCMRLGGITQSWLHGLFLFARGTARINIMSAPRKAVSHTTPCPRSWVVISGVMSPLIWVISIVTLLITIVVTTHEPPRPADRNIKTKPAIAKTINKRP